MLAMPPADGAEAVRCIVDMAEEVLPRLRPLSAAEFLMLDLPPRRLILDPILPEKGLMLVHAYRGIGKTHLALGIGYCAAIGGRMLGWSAPTPRRVLYLDGEMPACTMKLRLAAVIEGADKQPPDPSYFEILSADIIEGGLPDLGTGAGQHEIDAAIAYGNRDFIIIDNCSTLIRTGKENEGDSWLPVQSWALAHRRAGRSIVFVHHDGKGGHQRGTSRREDVLDTVIGLKRPADYRSDQGARFEIIFEKARGFYGEGAQPFEARYETRDGAAVWTRTEISDPELSRVADAIRDGMSIRDAADELGLSRSRSSASKSVPLRTGCSLNLAVQETRHD
jgi:putative DNA primase/helicase